MEGITSRECRPVNPRSPAGPIDASAESKSAAQQFEALLLSMLFEKMDESFGSLGEKEEEAGAANFRGMGLQAVSSALAAFGGIGIGKMVLPALNKENHADLKEVPTLPISSIEVTWKQTQVASHEIIKDF